MTEHAPHALPVLAILTNTVAPYRLPIYRNLAARFRVHVFTTSEASIRTTWNGIDRDVPNVTIERTRGIGVSYVRRVEGIALDRRVFQIPLGHLWDLFRLRPDAIVTNEMGARTLIALLYGLVFRRPVWVWWGGTMHTERAIGVAKRGFRRVLVRGVRRWISYGETSSEYLSSVGVSGARIVQVQNCVDEALFRAEAVPRFHLTPRPVLMCVGQLVPRKGVDLFLRAAASLQRRGEQFSILIVGDGPDRAALEAHARTLELQHVEFASGVTPAEMPAVYRSADVLVFPTLEDVWGLVINEALWSGLQVVASVCAGGAREILDDAHVFDPLDPDGFEAVLRKAIRSELPPARTNRLLLASEVSHIIAADIEAVLRH